jgi:hypothetical protein
MIQDAGFVYQTPQIYNDFAIAKVQAACFTLIAQIIGSPLLILLKHS